MSTYYSINNSENIDPNIIIISSNENSNFNNEEDYSNMTPSHNKYKEDERPIKPLKNNNFMNSENPFGLSESGFPEDHTYNNNKRNNQKAKIKRNKLNKNENLKNRNLSSSVFDSNSFIYFCEF